MIEKEGVIFQYHPFRHSGDQAKLETPESPSRKEVRDSGLARMTVFVGNFLIFFSLLGLFATLAPTLFYEASFRLKQIRGIEYNVSQDIPQKIVLPVQAKTTEFKTALSNSKEPTLIPKDTSFNILIPKLGLNEKVFANVDASNENEYSPVLQKGAAHAKGTYFPGQDGNIYIFAHSGENFWDAVKFNNIFYLLKDLKPKDEIVIFFDNKRHNYIVDKLQVINSSQVSFITQAKTGKEQLVLQTCWPPLTTWNRLLVFAKPI